MYYIIINLISYPSCTVTENSILDHPAFHSNSDRIKYSSYLVRNIAHLASSEFNYILYSIS